MDQNSANTSASVSLSMPIFDGLRIPNDIAARKLDLKAAVETLNKAKEDLSINVASYYLQVLYNKEVQKIAELQVALSNEQVVKTEALVKNGKVPLSQLYDMKAQLAKDEVSLTDIGIQIGQPTELAGMQFYSPAFLILLFLLQIDVMLNCITDAFFQRPSFGEFLPPSKSTGKKQSRSYY